ncbi:MAG: hypothetical protein QM786_10820 [Breznakibacter sp.]
MSKIFCPNCYSEFENQPEKCKCGYPFNGDDMDKYKFMSARIKKEKILQEGIKNASYSRNILFIIGGLNLLISLIFAFSANDNLYYLTTILYSVILIGLGFYSYKEPFFALLLGFIVVVLIYAVIGFISPAKLLSGLILKIVFVSSFIYGLVKIKQSENIDKNV